LPPSVASLGTSGILNSGVLDEGIVLLHVNLYQFTDRLEKHLEIFALGGLLVEVDHKQGF